MTPIFVHITANGKIHASCDVTWSPAGTVVQSFQINPNCANQSVATLTGSGNSSASALAVSATSKSGKGNEIV